MGLVVLFRTGLFVAFKRKSPDCCERGIWEDLFLAGSTVAGLVWGSAGLFLYPQDDPHRQIVLILFIVGIAAGSSTTLSPRREVSLPFLIMLLGPLIYTIWGEQYEIVKLVLAGLIYCLLFLIASSLNNYSTHKINIMLRIRSAAREEVLRRSEQALQLSEEKFRTMTEDGSDIVATIDSKGKIGFISQSVERILGYKSTTLLGRTWFDYIELDDHEQFRHAIKRIISHAGESVPVELDIRDSHGEIHQFEVRGRTVPGYREVIVNARDAVSGVDAPQIRCTLAACEPDKSFYQRHPEIEPGRFAHATEVVTQAPDQASIPEGRGELIMIVDDDQAVLDTTTDALESLGYKVIDACDGAQALEMFPLI